MQRAHHIQHEIQYHTFHTYHTCCPVTQQELNLKSEKNNNVCLALTGYWCTKFKMFFMLYPVIVEQTLEYSMYSWPSISSLLPNNITQWEFTHACSFLFKQWCHHFIYVISSNLWLCEVYIQPYRFMDGWGFFSIWAIQCCSFMFPVAKHCQGDILSQ